MNEKGLRNLLRESAEKLGGRNRPQPDCAVIHEELKKKSVTLQLLWREYKEANPDGYQSTQFCGHYRCWKQKLQASMRQTHQAGEKMFVDYAGQTVAIHDRETGKILAAQIFVAVLGASNYTYAEATWDQPFQTGLALMFTHLNILEVFRKLSWWTI